ncbi:unnamed protein product [Phyllotreta striolata]|uniref:Uncharacterized protein n=1 Tax=Phyllotreta striolata TaxID=444603 RepID=A0A9P0GUV2_PHYSR|nr:unnamed protein product [Phyllotreta striolata]
MSMPDSAMLPSIRYHSILTASSVRIVEKKMKGFDIGPLRGHNRAFLSDFSDVRAAQCQGRASSRSCAGSRKVRTWKAVENSANCAKQENRKFTRRLEIAMLDGRIHLEIRDRLNCAPPVSSKSWHYFQLLFPLKISTLVLCPKRTGPRRLTCDRSSRNSENIAPDFAIFRQFFTTEQIGCNTQNKHYMVGSDLDKDWDDFKRKFNKTYSNYNEFVRRKSWEENMNKIKKHNEEALKGKHSYFLKDNHLSDMSNYQYLRKMVKLTSSRHRKIDAERVGDIYERLLHIPESINWVEKGFKTPYYNQRDCGSCYAFSIAGAIQAQIFKQTDRLVPLSEQQIVDCSLPYGNYGCAGGSLRNTLKYLEKVGGLMAYSDYPYKSKKQKCSFDKHKALVNLTSWAVLPARDERALEVAVAKIGPVAVSINASPDTFQLYHTGVYDDPACSSDHVNHAVLVVGYTKDAWIIKNWWGKHWGDNGYMKLKRRKNRCGISNYAAYALI